VLGASGCSFFAPQATMIHYDPSDGVATRIGSISASNVVAVSEDGTTANLVFAFSNDSAKTEYVTVQYTNAAGVQKDNLVKVAPGVTPVGYDDGESITMYDIDATVGGLVPVYIHYGTDNAGKGLMVPVLDGTQPQFSTLVPAPAATPAG
jgi:hypothetical protein